MKRKLKRNPICLNVNEARRGMVAALLSWTGFDKWSQSLKFNIIDELVHTIIKLWLKGNDHTRMLD